MAGSFGGFLTDVMAGGSPEQQMANFARAAPGGPGTAAGSSPGAPGSMQGAAPPMPAAQATQPPPDLATLYARLMQQERSSEGIDRGMANIAAAFAAPGTGGQVYNSLAPDRRDVGSELENLYRMQKQSGLTAAIPGLVKAGIIKPEMIPVLQNYPSLLEPLISSMYGPSNPTTALNQRAMDWQNKHQGKPLPDYFGSPETMAAHDTQIQDLTRAQSQNSLTLGDLSQSLGDMRAKTNSILDNPNLDSVITKAQRPGALKAARQNGWLLQQIPSEYGFNQDELNLLHDIDGLSAWPLDTLKSANPHLQSRLGNIGTNIKPLQDFDSGPENWRKNADSLIGSIDTTVANAAGAAGELGRVLGNSSLEMKVDPNFLPKGRGFLGEPKEMSADDLAEARKALPEFEKKWPGEGKIRLRRHLMVQGFLPPDNL